MLGKGLRNKTHFLGFLRIIKWSRPEATSNHQIRRLRQCFQLLTCFKYDNINLEKSGVRNCFSEDCPGLVTMLLFLIERTTKDAIDCSFWRILYCGKEAVKWLQLVNQIGMSEWTGMWPSAQTRSHLFIHSYISFTKIIEEMVPLMKSGWVFINF